MPPPSPARAAAEATMRRRQAWLRVHRWFALGAGWILAVVALVGATLVIARPLDEHLHPALFLAAGGAPAPADASLEAVRGRLVGEFGPGADLSLRPPRRSGESLRASVRGPWEGTVFIDPANGREQGRRADDRSVVTVLFKLHSTLLIDGTGRPLLAMLALGYLLLLATGLWLWWPRRWPPSLRVTLSAGAQRAAFDLHRTVGAVMALLIAVSVASGAFMAWRPLGDFVTFLSGGTSIKPPALPKLLAKTTPPSVDTLLATAQARFPDGIVGLMQVPAKPTRPVRVRLRLPDDPHPNGLTSVWLDPRTGAVLATQRWNALDLGARAAAIVYPLHTGELGGVPLQAMAFLNGLALGTLGLTGIALWALRRRRRRAG